MPSTALYVSLQGNDRWSGQLPEPKADRTDGPLATLGAARNAVRELKRTGRLSEAATVFLRGGRYHLTAPVVFGPDDSAPVTYTSYAGEEAVISGGRRISGWQKETVNGLAAWVVDIPEAAAGTWYFRQLFVNGQRRNRPRLPREGFYRTLDWPVPRGDEYIFFGSKEFRTAPGEFKRWRNLTDVEVVLLHWWIEERLPVASFDEATGTVISSRKSRMEIRDERDNRGAKYYIDNVFEALGEPGDWYLDRQTGRLTYIPLPGEDPATAEVFVPVTDQLLRLIGNPDAGRYVEYLRFTGIAFEHTEWRPADNEYGGSGQAAADISGAIYCEGTRYCTFEDCRVAHVGGYGIELGPGCSGNRIVGCEVTDTGAGGIKQNGSDGNGSVCRRTGFTRITDNHLHHGGHVFHSAVGVLSMHANDNVISHNHIHDYYYSGVSCGWVWGYAESVSKNNRIEKNHIHDIGHGWLSDMGGIYTLGVQLDTVLRGNLIHDVNAAAYGGWAIYPDEGSSHLVIEDNVCYRTSYQVFHQHYGRENTVRNNIWAFGSKGNMRRTRNEPHVSFTIERNVVLSNGQPIWWDSGPEHGNMFCDLNLYWCTDGPVTISNCVSNQEWHSMGYDTHSIIADPLFGDPAKGDFTLADNSPAFGLGFRRIDLTDVGPRPKEQRE